MRRRRFGKDIIRGAAAFSLVSPFLLSCNKGVASQLTTPRFQVSLAQWSLNRAINGGELNHLDFAKKANALGFNAIEYVSQFFDDKATSIPFLNQMNSRAEDNNIKQLLIMVDIPNRISDLDVKARRKAVEEHFKWVDAAHHLGCHSIRVNLFGLGDANEVAKASVDGMSALCEYASQAKINIIVENHGQYSSDANWLSNVITKINKSNCGTLPDFGNFCIEREGGELWGAPCIKEYDKYLGVKEMMPFAKAVSAKSFEFDADGNETSIDFKRMMNIVKASPYSGYIGVEYEGDKHSEEEGIFLTKQLIERYLI